MNKAKTNTIIRTDRKLHRNIWATSFTSFFMDVSSEMVLNILPLFLSNVLGVKTNIIGLIEGVAESTSSLMKLVSGRISDVLGKRKGLAVLGYALSALSKPFFAVARSWGVVAAVRWVDRLGKGIRTAPRDALVADSAQISQRGLAFGFHRAADTAGAVVGLLIAMIAVHLTQENTALLGATAFRTIALLSLIPAFLAVAILTLGAVDISASSSNHHPTLAFKSLGKPFIVFLFIVGLFELGNSSDAFLILRAQERGMSVIHILGMLIAFNLVYALLSTPAGALSDRLPRRFMLIGGWLVYAAIYLGFALAQAAWHVWALYIGYGVYYGMAYGTAKAFVADLVPGELRGTAYGTYNAVLGILDFPASFIAGLLWQGAGAWQGFGASAPFFFAAVMALVATLLLFTLLKDVKHE